MSDLENKIILAKNLQYYMDLNKKNRNKVCNDLNFKYTTLTDWINAKKYPRIDKIEILANYFEIEKSDLMENKYDEKIKKITTDKGITIKYKADKHLTRDDLFNLTRLMIDIIEEQEKQNKNN